MKQTAPDRARTCATCSETFYPRPVQIRNGKGRFCSQKCNTASHRALISPEAKAKGQERLRQLRSEGLVTSPSGPANSRWKGGKKEYQKRRRDSGKDAEMQRAYYAANREKRSIWNRENHNRRRASAATRLSNGTVPSIGNKQKWKCAICRINIKQSYHVDHIMPLARGGLHESRNIQLLCPPCNLQKGAKDPATHMRERGMLL